MDAVTQTALEQALRHKRERLHNLLQEKLERHRRRRIYTYFPDEGPLRRELYQKHLDFFAGGREARERLLLAANRIGKTESAGGYETVLHLTGLYDEIAPWWPGRKFPMPTDVWVAGDTGQTTRDILQAVLLGPVGEWGTGLIPGELLGRHTMRTGIPDAIDTIQIKHKSGGWSRLGFKSFDQGRRSFQGTGKHVVWLDEECPDDVYHECKTRTMTTGGVIYLTFTPLKGMTPLILEFLPGGRLPESAHA